MAGASSRIFSFDVFLFVSWAVVDRACHGQVLATDVVESFSALRGYLREVANCLERVDPLGPQRDTPVERAEGQKVATPGPFKVRCRGSRSLRSSCGFHVA